MVKDDDKLSSELQCSIENEIKRLISVSSLVIIFKVEHACMDDQHKCFFSLRGCLHMPGDRDDPCHENLSWTTKRDFNQL